MKKLIAPTVRLSLLSAAFVLSAPASAQSTWNLYSASSATYGTNGNQGSYCTQNAGNAGTYNNSWNCTPVAGGNGGSSLTASAWSSDRGTNVWVRPDNPATSSTNEYKRVEQIFSPGTGYVDQYLSGSGYASAYLSPQGNSGFGAASRTEGLGATSPNHAFDSTSPGTMDLMLLDFGSTSVVLDAIGIGWWTNDADITVMRWVGSSGPTRTTGTTAIGGSENLSDKVFDGTSGWELVGSYLDLRADNTLPFGGTAVATGATSSQASSWWLISTYNSSMARCSTGCDTKYDSFKINYVKTSIPQTQVPEPGSMALVGAALLGMFGTRRKVRTGT